MRPLHQPRMADDGGFGQPGGAGGVDVERAVVDRDARVRSASRSGRPGDRRWSRRCAETARRRRRRAPRPSARRREIAPHRGHPIGELRVHDQVPRRGEVDAMGQRGPREIRVESAATPPARVTPSQMARYSGRFGISSATASPLAEPLRERPSAHSAVDCRARPANVRHSSVREQRRRVAVRARPAPRSRRAACARAGARSAPSAQRARPRLAPGSTGRRRRPVDRFMPCCPHRP